MIQGIYLEKTITQKDTCTAVFIAAVFTIPYIPLSVLGRTTGMQQ